MTKLSAEQLLFIKKQKHRRQIVVSIRLWILLLFFVLWECAACMGWIDSFIFSSPSKICLCFYQMTLDRSIFLHTGITLAETLLSFLFVIIASLAIATLLWFFPRLSDILDPYFVVLNSLPKSALAPLLIVWLGATKTTIVVCGMSVAIFGSVLTLYTSFATIDQEKIKLIYTLHGTKYHALTKVILPGSIPAILSIMKVNIGLCLVGVIIGEFLAAKEGLGYLIIYASQTFKLDWLLMSILILCLMAMGLYACLTLLEHWYAKKVFKQ